MEFQNYLFKKLLSLSSYWLLLTFNEFKYNRVDIPGIAINYYFIYFTRIVYIIEWQFEHFAGGKDILL